MEFNRNNVLAFGARDGLIRLWDTRSPVCGATTSKASAAVCKIQSTRNEFCMAAAYADGVIKIWDIRTHKMLKDFGEVVREGLGANFHLDQATDALFAIGRTHKEVLIWANWARPPTAAIASAHELRDVFGSLGDIPVAIAACGSTLFTCTPYAPDLFADSA